MSLLGDEKNLDPLNQPAICFLLLVPYINICKIIPPECTKTHHFDIKKSKKNFCFTPCGEEDTPPSRESESESS